VPWYWRQWDPLKLLSVSIRRRYATSQKSNHVQQWKSLPRWSTLFYMSAPLLCTTVLNANFLQKKKKLHCCKPNYTADTQTELVDINEIILYYLLILWQRKWNLETVSENVNERQHPNARNLRKDSFTEFCFGLYKSESNNVIWTCAKMTDNKWSNIYRKMKTWNLNTE
jgi:hypothetical protein